MRIKTVLHLYHKKHASLSIEQGTHTTYEQPNTDTVIMGDTTLINVFFGAVFASKGYPFKNMFDFTTAGDWDCVAAVERLPALHYSVDFIFLTFGIMGFIVEL